MQEMASGADIASACKVLLHVLSIDIRRKTMLFLKQHSVYFNSGDTRQCPICEHVHISVYYFTKLILELIFRLAGESPNIQVCATPYNISLIARLGLKTGYRSELMIFVKSSPYLAPQLKLHMVFYLKLVFPS